MHTEAKSFAAEKPAMPWGSVRVSGPALRDVYLNGNYAQAAGQTGTIFIVEYGANTFETLDSARQVDFRAEAVVNRETPHTEVTLAEMIPPEVTRETPAADDVDGGPGTGEAP
jgi:hypothetical protein